MERRPDEGAPAEAAGAAAPGKAGPEGRVGPLGRVRDRVNVALNARKDRASHVLEEVAGSVRRIGEPLQDAALAPLGTMADEAASRIEQFAAGIREHDVADLAEDLRGLARRRPAVFAAAGFAAGLVAARFLKSSAEEPSQPGEAVTPRSHEGGRSPAGRSSRGPTPAGAAPSRPTSAATLGSGTGRRPQ